MGFFARLGFGWRLGKESLGVVMRDKSLMLFPVLSGLASAAIVASFFLGIGPDELGAALDAMAGDSETGMGEHVPTYIATFLVYLLLYFVAIYFNTALVAAAQLSLQGVDTSPADGMGAANEHLGHILLWSVISATVGLLLSALENEERIGRFISGLIGVAWQVLTYFVVPVMVFERTGPFTAIGRSVSIMRETWGENVGAQFSVGLLVLVMNLVAFLVLGALAVLVPGFLPVAIGLFVLAAIFFSLLSVAAKSVLMVGLYRYSVEDDADLGPFDRGELGAAFAKR